MAQGQGRLASELAAAESQAVLRAQKLSEQKLLVCELASAEAQQARIMEQEQPQQESNARTEVAEQMVNREEGEDAGMCANVSTEVAEQPAMSHAEQEMYVHQAALASEEVMRAKYMAEVQEETQTEDLGA